MASPNFIDYIKIWIKSGDGGPGSVHFNREKYIPKGGPDGGDGGRGGSIIFKGNQNLNTLLHLKYKRHIKAENGDPGQGNNKSGADADDIIIEVPLGTVFKNEEESAVLGEVTEHDQIYVAAMGGKGGLGNSHFKSATRQTPRYAQPGLPGEEKNIILELKILADVGMVGFPNAGKSTLLSKLSAAKPKIADYPFTTIVPNIGVVSYRDNNSFVLADIPGIIENASQGKGLGSRFLRHIERNAVLLFMIDPSAHSVKESYYTLLNELNNHDKTLSYKKRLLVITKSDMLDNELIEEIIKKDLPDIDYVFISSFTQVGLQKLKDKLWALLTS